MGAEAVGRCHKEEGGGFFCLLPCNLLPVPSIGRGDQEPTDTEAEQGRTNRQLACTLRRYV